MIGKRIKWFLIDHKGWVIFIIIVPVVNLLLRDDYVEPLRTPSGVLLSDSDPGKDKKDTWTCECGKVNQAFTGTCSCGKTKREVLTRQVQPQKSPAEKDGSTNKE